MGEKDDLGLSLSLSFPQSHLHHHHHHQHRQPLQLNLMPCLVPPSSASSAQSGFNLQKRSCNDAFASSSDRNSETRSFLRGIDVNREPSVAAAADYGEDEAGVSSPNSMVSTVSGKRSERDHQSQTNGDDLDNERASSRGGSDEEDGDMSRKKLRLSKDQSAVLEESFKEHNTLNPKQKLALAKQLGLRPRQVEVWFQNRRARTKLKQTEVDCEYLKRCCESLTEENRRLQKEVHELRALKLSPQFYMHLSPPTTLTMCPSCERVAAPPLSTVGGRPLADVPPHPHPRPVPLINPWAPAAAPLAHAHTHTPFDALRSCS